MASAIEYLKAAKAQLQLSSPVGRWAENVSRVMDSLVNGGAQQPQFLFAKQITAQPGAGAGTNLVLDGEGLSRDIAYNPATGTATLTPGKTYLLRAHGGADTFSNGTGGSIQVQFVDDSNAVIQSSGVDCPKANLVPDTGTGNVASAPSVEMTYSVPVNATPTQRSVKLRITSANGTCNLPSNSWTLIVQEIAGGV